MLDARDISVKSRYSQHQVFPFLVESEYSCSNIEKLVARIARDYTAQAGPKIISTEAQNLHVPAGHPISIPSALVDPASETNESHQVPICEKPNQALICDVLSLLSELHKFPRSNVVIESQCRAPIFASVSTPKGKKHACRENFSKLPPGNSCSQLDSRHCHTLPRGYRRRSEPSTARSSRHLNLLHPLGLLRPARSPRTPSPP